MSVSIVTAISLDEFRAEIGVEPTGDQSVLDQKILERIFNTACQIVGDRTIEETPVALKNQAILMMGGYLYTRPKVAQNYTSQANVWTNSGASMILSDYLIRPSALLGEA